MLQLVSKKKVVPSNEIRPRGLLKVNTTCPFIYTLLCMLLPENCLQNKMIVFVAQISYSVGVAESQIKEEKVVLLSIYFHLLLC